MSKISPPSFSSSCLSCASCSSFPFVPSFSSFSFFGLPQMSCFQNLTRKSRCSKQLPLKIVQLKYLRSFRHFYGIELQGQVLFQTFLERKFFIINSLFLFSETNLQINPLLSFLVHITKIYLLLVSSSDFLFLSSFFRSASRACFNFFPFFSSASFVFSASSCLKHLNLGCEYLLLSRRNKRILLYRNKRIVE